MGLRINTNLPATRAVRLLQGSDKMLSRSLERLSTGLRINRASDDPSGLVISEQLRAQINSLEQASENAQNAANLLNTTEAALNEVNSILVQLRESAIYALNTGGASIEQINAEQDSVDQALEAIDRVASTTRFATRHLLNGASAFNVRSQSSAITDLEPISVTFDKRSSETSFSLVVTQGASQATLSAVGASGVVASGGSVTLRITGGLGTEDITIPSGSTSAVLDDSINLLRGATGVYMSGGQLFSDEFGSESLIRLQKVGGAGAFSGAGGALVNDGDFTDDFGVDVSATLNGVPTRADGNNLTVVSNIFTGSIRMEELSAASNYTFTIRNSGLLFQLSDQAEVTDQAIIGLPSIYSNVLGRQVTTTGGVDKYGFLSSLSSGELNDLRNDPGNALRIIDTAIDQVTKSRAYLGAFTNNNIEPALRQLSVHLENLSASESTLRDLDFAEETAELTRTQVLYQAGLSVIAQANAIPQGVIQLLQ